MRTSASGKPKFLRVHDESPWLWRGKDLSFWLQNREISAHRHVDDWQLVPMDEYDLPGGIVWAHSLTQSPRRSDDQCVEAYTEAMAVYDKLTAEGRGPEAWAEKERQRKRRPNRWADVQAKAKRAKEKEWAELQQFHDDFIRRLKGEFTDKEPHFIITEPVESTKGKPKRARPVKRKHKPGRGA